MAENGLWWSGSYFVQLNSILRHLTPTKSSKFILQCFNWIIILTKYFYVTKGFCGRKWNGSNTVNRAAEDHGNLSLAGSLHLLETVFLPGFSCIMQKISSVWNMKQLLNFRKPSCLCAVVLFWWDASETDSSSDVFSASSGAKMKLLNYISVSLVPHWLKLSSQRFYWKNHEHDWCVQTANRRRAAVTVKTKSSLNSASATLYFTPSLFLLHYIYLSAGVWI